MRKGFLIIKLVVIISTIISCSSDDDSQSDPLVGTWKLIEFVSDGSTIVIGCQTETLYQFKMDGTYVIDIYNEDSNDNCVQDDILNGEWNNNGEGFYEFKPETAQAFEAYEVIFDGDTFSIIDGTSTSKYQRQ